MSDDGGQLSLRDQARLLDVLLSRTVTHKGAVAEFTALNVTRSDVRHLTQLVNRLYILARFEDQIRELVKWGRVGR